MSSETFTITCPNCNFPLTQTIAQPFIDAERTKLQAEAREQEAALRKREAALVEQQRTLEALQGQLNARQVEIDASVEAKLRVEREALIKAGEQRVSAEFTAKLAAAELELANKPSSWRPKTTQLQHEPNGRKLNKSCS